MSNNAVGNIYQQIINEVIEASRVDFEEGGVEENVLEDLRKVGSFSLLSVLSCLSPFINTIMSMQALFNAFGESMDSAEKAAVSVLPSYCCCSDSIRVCWGWVANAE